MLTTFYFSLTTVLLWFARNHIFTANRQNSTEYMAVICICCVCVRAFVRELCFFICFLNFKLNLIFIIIIIIVIICVIIVVCSLFGWLCSSHLIILYWLLLWLCCYKTVTGMRSSEEERERMGLLEHLTLIRMCGVYSILYLFGIIWCAADGCLALWPFIKFILQLNLQQQQNSNNKHFWCFSNKCIEEE